VIQLVLQRQALPAEKPYGPPGTLSRRFSKEPEVLEGVTHADAAAPLLADGPGAGATVLIADDDAGVSRLLAQLLARAGYHVDVVDNGPAALGSLAESAPDVAILDINMPGLSGIDVCRHIKANAETRLIPVILMTGLESRDLRLAGIAAGASDFLAKPIDICELTTRVRSLVQVKRYTDDLESAASVMMTLASMIEARDGYLEGHCHRMANYAVAVGQSLELGEADLQALRRGAFLHDIGMLVVPDSVLRKTTALEPEEYELIKSHTVLGESLVNHLRSLRNIGPIIRHHHERRDGSGYPDGLHGDAIPLLAQIIGVVDVFEALTSARAYRQAASIDRAIEVLHDHVRQGWRRADLVEHLVGVITARRTA
jgi:putative two-component system response regulator